MKTLTIIVTVCIFSANGRLIDKNTEKNHDTSPTETTSPVRVSRQAFYDDGIGISGEESVVPQEVVRSYIRKGRYSIKSKSSDTKVTKADKQTTTAVTKAASESEETKPLKTLVKKPIPKFKELDYEDFQGKINKSPLKYADSGEHEDEDFNLDDYEFDVNHDEYAGRGKPLEPRTKLKITEGNPEKKTLKTRPASISPPEIKMQSKVLIPAQPLVRTKNGVSKKAAHKMKEDYYDDIITTTKAPEVEVKAEDDFSDDAEESKELNNKNPVRMARSPGMMEVIASKMGDKTATLMSFLQESLPSILRHEVYPSTYGDIGDLANHPMIDPLTGDRFMF